MTDEHAQEQPIRAQNMLASSASSLVLCKPLRAAHTSSPPANKDGFKMKPRKLTPGINGFCAFEVYCKSQGNK